MSDIQAGMWVVSTNPLHTDNGVGAVQQIRNEQAKVEFRPTVFSRSPYFLLPTRSTYPQFLPLIMYFIRGKTNPWQPLRKPPQPL